MPVERHTRFPVLIRACEVVDETGSTYKVIANVRAGDTVTVGIETQDRAVTLIASTGALGSSLPRAWKILALSRSRPRRSLRSAWRVS